MNLAAIEQLTFATLRFNLRCLEVEARRFNGIFTRALESLGGAVPPLPQDIITLDDAELRAISSLLAQRVLHRKYGKNAPLATIEELQQMESGNSTLAMPETDVMPEEVEETMIEATGEEVGRLLHKLPVMSWSEWQKWQELIKSLAKKHGTDPVAFLALANAHDLITRATQKKNEYRKSATKKFEFMVEQTEQSLRTISEATLAGLAGTSSKHYAEAQDVFEMMPQLFEMIRPRLLALNKAQIEEDIQRIYPSI